MKKYTIIVFCMYSIAIFGQENKIQRVGEEVLKTYESFHPYDGSKTNESEIVWSEDIVFIGASYIAVHFSQVELTAGDFIVVKSSDGKRLWKYVDLNIDSTSKGLWSIHIYGEKAIIEIHSKNKEGSYGYSIDKIARGYNKLEMKDLESKEPEAICGDDNSLEAKCYQNSEPVAYNKSKAVARLLINGTGACTGWLIGSDGHLMTNNHCIESASDAKNVTVEFMAEGSNCDTNCQYWFGCPGTIEATSTTLVQTDISLDYSLLKLPNNVSNLYGFLQLRDSDPVLNERIYIPQHPSAWGKRVALVSDDNPNGFPTVTSLSIPSPTGAIGDDVGYFADTRRGSSGSPVISYNQHLVVALHHWGSCPNKGVPINDIINHLGANLPTNATSSSNCTNNLTFTKPISGFLNEEAQNWIEGKTNNVIQEGADVTYNAGEYIILKPGFWSTYNSKFLGKIDGCETQDKPATLNGSTKICENKEVFTLENGGSNVNWSVSSNLEIISSNDKEIKINVKDKNTINKGFVKAILSNGKEVSVNIKVGIPNGYQNFTIAYGPGALYELESKQFWVKESLNGNWLWEWSMNNSAAKGAGSVVIIKPLTTGSLTVKARLKNECGLGNWLTKTFYVESFVDPNNPKGPNFPKNRFNDEANTNNILVYPNPVKNMMTIVNHSDETLIINLYNLTGKLMLSQTIAENSTDIDTSNLPNGVFLLKVNGDSTLVQKVIIQH